MTISQNVLTCRVDAIQNHVSQIIASDSTLLSQSAACQAAIAALIPATISLDPKGILTCCREPTYSSHSYSSPPFSSSGVLQSSSSHNSYTSSQSASGMSGSRPPTSPKSPSLGSPKSKHSRQQFNLRKHQWTLASHELQSKVNETHYVLCLVRYKSESGFFRSLKRFSGDISGSTLSSSNANPHDSTSLLSSSPTALNHSRTRSRSHSLVNCNSLQDGLTTLMSNADNLVSIVLVFSREVDCNWWKEALTAQGSVFSFNTCWMLPLSFPVSGSQTYTHGLFDDISHVSWAPQSPREQHQQPQHRQQRSKSERAHRSVSSSSSSSTSSHVLQTCSKLLEKKYKTPPTLDKSMIKIEGLS